MIDKETANQFQEHPTMAKTLRRQASPPPNSDSKTYPEPKFTINESYSIPDMPVKPTNYIRFIELTKEEEDARVEYDMDEEDFAWLESANEERVKNGLDEVSLDAFEILMDRFEKECYFEIKTADNEKGALEICDEEAVCCICSDGECQISNEILFCDMCNLAVHQECYGIPYIPEGQWLCRRCVYSPSKTVDCLLCPSNAGAFKMACDGYWAHILCAIWIPEIQFANPVFLEPIDSVDKIPPARWRLTCHLCKQKGIGACIQCTQKKCNVSFHATCGQQAGLYMKFSGKPGDPNSKLNRTAFCSDHTPQTIKEENDRFKKLKNKMLKSVKSPIVFTPIVPPERIQEISHLVNFKKKNIFILRLLAYWTLKRHTRFGVPLLPKRYIMRKNDIPSLNQKPNESSDKEYKCLLLFRQEMEKLRLLLELTRKREKLKYELIKQEEKIIDAKLMPIVPYLRKLLKTLTLLDEDDVFEKPVDLKIVPTYTEIIKNPMDFSTISSKIDKYCYTSLQEFESDFNLMINNCLRFNGKGTFYYNYAVALRQKSKPILKEAKQIVQCLEDDYFFPEPDVNIKGEPHGDSSDSNTSEEKSFQKKKCLKRKYKDVSSDNDSDENESPGFSEKETRDKNKNTLILNRKRNAGKIRIKTEEDIDSVSSNENVSYSRRIRTTKNGSKNENQYSL